MLDQFAFIDIETTSLDKENTEIIEIAVITFENNKAKYYTKLIKPIFSIPNNIEKLTGITNKEIKREKEFHEYRDDLLSLLRGRKIVAHNVEFDYEVLKNHFLKTGVDFESKTLCTLKIAKSIIPGLESYSLKALAHFLGIKFDNSHRALVDAKVCAEVYLALKELYWPKNKIKKLRFLPAHSELISNSHNSLGIITYHKTNGLCEYKISSCVKEDLEKDLCLSYENKNFLSSLENIKIEYNHSFVKNYLRFSNLGAKKYFSLTYKIDQSKIILSITNKSDDNAFEYFSDHKSAKKRLYEILKIITPKKFAHQDFNKDSKLQYEKDKLNAFREYLNRVKYPYKLAIYTSLNHENSLYTHLVIKDGIFLSEIQNESEVFSIHDQMKYRKLSNNEKSSLLSAHIALKNKNVKEDKFRELSMKRHPLSTTH